MTDRQVQTEKADQFIALQDGTAFKIVRNLTNDQRQKVQESTILLRTGQAYMHYWTENLECPDRNDPEWQNKVMFFWKAEEPFPNKSLPPVFETFSKKHFLFKGDTSEIQVLTAKALPWFGMPGLGNKFQCKIANVDITIPELADLGFIDYIETIELTDQTIVNLTNREKYYFLVDTRITTFSDGNFYLGQTPITIDIAYIVGAIHLIKVTNLT